MERDVPSRLAEGLPAVANLQHYVWACHQLGYRHPELTMHARQVHDWYGSEEGMDLAALHSDCLAFDDAHRAALDALALQERQLSMLSAVWQGVGAQACRDFLRRHGEASASAAAALRTAADALCALRENLWQAVDTKVDAVIAIEGRPQAHRAEWLAAAATVTTGVGDRSAAAELVDQAVKPFVDSSIRRDWLTAMHTAASTAADAYQRATTELMAEHQPEFDVPGDLGPTWSRLPAQSEAAPEEGRPSVVSADDRAAPGMSGPSAWTAIPATPSAPPVPWAPPVPMVPAATEPHPPSPETPVGPAVPPMTPPAGLGSGMPDFGSGLSGIGQRFADTLSGLPGGLDSFTDMEPGLGDSQFDADPDDDEPDGRESDDDEPDDESGADESDGEESEGEAGAGEQSDDETVDGPVDSLHEVASDSAPAPLPAPPAAEPLPPADLAATDPVVAEQTPCAIAADELPQVGDPLE